jgi:hypothetical protein
MLFARMADPVPVMGPVPTVRIMLAPIIVMLNRPRRDPLGV